MAVESTSTAKIEHLAPCSILAPNSNVKIIIIHVVSKFNLSVPQVFQNTFLDTEASSL